MFYNHTTRFISTDSDSDLWTEVHYDNGSYQTIYNRNQVLELKKDYVMVCNRHEAENGMLIDSMFDVLNIEQCSFGYEEKTQIYPKEKMMNETMYLIDDGEFFEGNAQQLDDCFGIEPEELDSFCSAFNCSWRTEYREYPHRNDNNED